MMNFWVFGVTLAHEDGRFRVTVRDLPEVVTSGHSEQEALEQAADAIEMSIAFRIKRGEELPVRSPVLDNEHAVTMSCRMTAKASIYEAWRATGLSKSELARRMNREEGEVRRILDPVHGTKLDQLEEAARALGGRLSVAFTQA